MDEHVIKSIFASQKERMKLAIEELSDLKASLQGDQKEQVESTLNFLRRSLEDDEDSFARF